MIHETGKESAARRRKFNSLLESVEITKKQLATELGISVKTVTNWKKTPEYALAYLRLLKKHRVAQHIIGHYMSMLKELHLPNDSPS
jgi:DNA-binding transcriptional regulator YiaG